MSKLTGEWDRVDFALLAMQRSPIPEKMKRAFFELGEAIENVAKNHILAQDLRFKPLSDEWVIKKGHEEFFLDTKFYLKNITVRSFVERKKITLIIGPKRSAIHPPSGQPLVKIAKWLEFGTSEGIPARPLWRRTRREVNKHPKFKEMKAALKGAFI